MNDLTLGEIEINLLKEVARLNTIEIVWDINAFYFNSNSNTYKLECLGEKPTGSQYQYDEIFYCRFHKLNERIIFIENDSDYWYKIISNDCKIISIQYMNILELFPDNKIVPIESADLNAIGLNKSTIGLIIETDKGFLPAFILPSNHGFTWQPKMELYSKAEIEKLISENVSHCETITCL